MTPQEIARTLDRTLRALGDAHPSSGFDDRLQTRLAQTSFAHSAQASRQLFTPVRQVFALCLCALLCTLGLLYRQHVQQGSSTHLNSKLATEQSPSRPITSNPIPQQNTSKLAAQHHKRLRRNDPLHKGNLIVGPDSAAIASPDAQALADLQTPSFPSPVLPSTSQERLVRLMLRRGEKHDLAQLDAGRAVQLANTEQRSFQKFFDPDPSPELALELKKGNLK